MVDALFEILGYNANKKKHNKEDSGADLDRIIMELIHDAVKIGFSETLAQDRPDLLETFFYELPRKRGQHGIRLMQPIDT